MSALDLIVKQGKALYVGISNYGIKEAREAIQILNRLGTPCIIHQSKYSMFERSVENGLLDFLEDEGIGCIPFSPLAQGLLTDKYLNGIPNDSRIAISGVFLNESHISKEVINKIQQLNNLAKSREKKLAHMALSWILKDSRITSVLIGASKPEQILDSLKALDNIDFSNQELEEINNILKN